MTGLRGFSSTARPLARRRFLSNLKTLHRCRSWRASAQPSGRSRPSATSILAVTSTAQAPKNAVVPIEGGSRTVALAAIESPKNWFEDFGSAELMHGVAVVKLDPQFIQTVNTEMDYKVFPVPNGDCKGLYVTHKTATSFEVRELGGGTASVAF